MNTATIQTQQQVKKREGHLVNFDISKIQQAIYKALLDSNTPHPQQTSHELAEQVELRLKDNPSTNLEIEQIQDMVESVLLDRKFIEAAKHYIIYRDEKRKIRDQKKKILQKSFLDSLDKKFSINQLRVLAERYLLRDIETGKIIESPTQLFKRVATLIALSDLIHDESIFNKDGDGENDFPEHQDPPYYEWMAYNGINEYHYERFCNLYHELDQNCHMKISLDDLIHYKFEYLWDDIYSKKRDEYFQLMANCIFLPNTPTLMNAGTPNGGLSACFVLAAPDSVDKYIRDTVGDAASIFRAAGGVGINFSNFRPEGAPANGVPNAASGPCSFIQMINTLTDVIKAGGKRRGANMGILDVNHPDIEQFITMKSTPKVLENFNVSVGIWGDYWDALISGKSEFTLKHATHHEKDRMINPQSIWDLIALSAWKSAEPGVLFFDNVNKVNHMWKDFGPMRASNPCGEQFLYPNDSCTLGSINVSKFVDPFTEGFDWLEFGETVKIATRFLDNVLDMNKYPTEQIRDQALAMRRIGLGIMGLADALFMMKIPYNSEEGFEFMAQLCDVLTSFSIDESVVIAQERGPYPVFNFESQALDIHKRRTASTLLFIASEPDEIQKYGIRNSFNTTIAPTGTISMIAGCSSGIEPEFALAFEKKVTLGSFFYSNQYLSKELKKAGIYSQELLQKITENGGSVQGIDEIPQNIKDVFVTAMDLHWTDHVVAQGICQQYIDNSISKTINMPHDVIVEDIKNAYLLAHELGCKGLSVYRDGSRNKQVLHTAKRIDGQMLKPSQAALDYIKENVTNEYVKEKLEGLFSSNNLDITPSSYTSTTKTIEYKLGHIHDNCPVCNNPKVYQEGCETCSNQDCIWSACTSS